MIDLIGQAYMEFQAFAQIMLGELSNTFIVSNMLTFFYYGFIAYILAQLFLYLPYSIIISLKRGFKQWLK